MSELTRDQIEAQKRYMPSLESLCDMALRTHDAEQRAERAEADNDRLRRWLQPLGREVDEERERAEAAEADSHEQRVAYDALFEEANKIREQRDQARQEAAKLRNAIRSILDYHDEWSAIPSSVIEGARCDLHSSDAPASELTVSTEQLRHYRCAHCNWWWSIGDGPKDPSVLHCPWCGRSQSADRPEPSEALEAFNALVDEIERQSGVTVTEYEQDAEPDLYGLYCAVRRHLSQPAPAVPNRKERSRAEDAVRRLHSAASRFGHHIHNQQEDMDRDKERILALIRTLADSARPAVPEWLKPTEYDQSRGWSWSLRGLDYIANLVPDTADGEPEPTREAVDAIITILHQERALANSAPPAVPDGYVMVSKEPTKEIIEAMRKRSGITPMQAEYAYFAAIAAAPTPDEGEG